MEVTTEQVGKRKYGGIIAVAVVLLASVMAGAFYQQELQTYVRLQGWDTAAVKQMVAQFVQEASEGKTSAEGFLDPAWVKPQIEGGKFVGVIQPSPAGNLGPTPSKVSAFISSPTIKECSVRIKNKSGVFQADVQYSDGQWAPIDVDRVQGALRIRSVPVKLSPTRPPVQAWD